MLIGLNEQNERIYADDAIKVDENDNEIKYHCPECGAELILKKGDVKIHHFAHKPNDDKSCFFKRFGGGESLIHDSMKRYIKQIIERDNNCLVSELEYPIGNRIADYYFEVKDKWGNVKKIAVECVHRHENINEFREKNEDYVDMGVYVLWIFNADRFIGGYFPNEDKPIEKHTHWRNEFRLKDILKQSHTMYFGKVYALNMNDMTMWGVHFDSVKRISEEVELIDWDEFYSDREAYPHRYLDMDDYKYTVGGNEYYLKGTKSPNPKIIPKFKITSFQYKPADKWLIFKRNTAQPFIKSWWKKEN